MSLRLLLDAHLSPRIARSLREHGIDAETLDSWWDGAYRYRSDQEVLAAAYAEHRVLVTYDLRTIPPLLRQLAEEGEHHAGVVLISQRTMPSTDIGGLTRALRTLAEDADAEQWVDRPHFL